jgi:hypothetical protein
MERDSTQDWLVPAESAPPLMRELEARVDEAMAIARASEAAVSVVGAAAIDAAEQARRAAELAERASAATAAAIEVQALGKAPPAPSEPREILPRGFTERADRVMVRLRALERGPHRQRPASGRAGARRPGD